MSNLTKAKDWLTKRREEFFGPKSNWTPDQNYRFEVDLGLLADFVTDCYPDPTDPVADKIEGIAAEHAGQLVPEAAALLQAAGIAQELDRLRQENAALRRQLSRMAQYVMLRGITMEDAESWTKAPPTDAD